EEGVAVDFRPVPTTAIDGAVAHLHQRAADLRARTQKMLQNLSCETPGSDAHRCLACRGTTAAPIIPMPVLGLIGIIGVAGAKPLADLAVVLGALVDVFDHQRHRSTGGTAFEHARQYPDLVRLATLRGKAGLTGPPAIKPTLKIRLIDGAAGGHAIDHAAARGAVALAPGREPEQPAEAVASHISSPPLLLFEVRQQCGRILRAVRIHHSDDVIAAVDVKDFAGNAAPELAEQVECGAADLLDRDVALQGSIELVPAQNVAEVADTGSGQRAHRPSRDRIDADAVGPEVGGEIAHARLERRLGDAHDIIVRHYALGAVIGEGEKAPALGHQLRGTAADIRERIAGDAHRPQKVLAGGVGIPALELILV